MSIRTLIFSCLAICLCSTSLTSTSLGQRRRTVADPEMQGNLINDVDKSKVAMHPATPFVESSTVALLQLNLSKIDLDANSQWLSNLPGSNPDQVAALRGGVEALRRAGVDSLFVSFSTRTALEGAPLLIVPCDDTTAVKNLAEAVIEKMPKRRPMKSHAGEEVVVIGPASAVDRVIEADSVMRPDLVLPLKAEERLDHTLVVSLPDEYREELEALWPEQSPDILPVEFSPRALVEDVQRLVVSWQLPPNPNAVVEIQCSDLAAAERTRGIVDRFLETAPPLQSSIAVNVAQETVTLKTQPEQFVQLLKSVLQPARDRALVMQTSNSMKQLALAFHNYHAAYKQTVPRVFTDREGKPLYSWRVALLPFIDQQALYDAMELDQPWDSDANREVTSTRIPSLANDEKLQNKTTFRAPVYPGSLWHGEGPPREFKDVRDGLSNTILFIEAPRSAAVEWARPDAWVLSDDLMTDIFGDREQVHMALMDGSVHVFEKSEMSNEKLKAMLTIDGGEPVSR